MSLGVRAAAWFVAAAVTMTACTTTDEGPRANATGTVSPSPGESPEATLPPEIFGEDASILTAAIREPSTLDPMRIQDPGSVLIARQLYEGLTAWDPIEEKVVPAAAESWKVADGGRRFVFELRSGMTFHDGSPVTAGDFEFAFDRIALKENASDLAYTLELVEGFTDVNQLGRSKDLSGIRTPDPLTLEIRLGEPFYDLPAVLTHPGLVPLPRRAVRNLDTFLSFPVGNGPFQMAQPWTTGQEVLLANFETFYRPAVLDGIRFRPYPDAAASWLEFLSGDLDVAEVPAGQIEAAAESFGEQAFKSLLAAYYFGINVRVQSLKDPRARRAISLAIDRKTIAQTIYRNTMIAPRGIIPEGMPGFEENVCLRICRYAPKKARALVRRLKAKDKRVVIEFNRVDPHGRVARFVAEHLEDVGFSASTRGYGFDRYLRLLRKGKQHLYRLGWIAEYPSPDVFLSSLFASSSPDNHSGFDFKRADRLLRRARREPSENKRLHLYLQAEKAVLRKLPVVPIGSFVNHWATQGVKDLFFDVMGGFDAASVALAEEETG
jgi:oligopeptide transport system substrate-binding protein